jgi:diguanylate cyclase (GGDEF)-like protein
VEKTTLSQTSVEPVSPPGHLQLVGACVMVLVTLSAVAFAIPYGRVQLPDDAGFMPAIGSLTVFADLFTAIMLIGHARTNRSRAQMYLAAAYSFSFLIIIPHLLSFPGVFAAGLLIGADGTAPWLWCAWHAGFAAFVAVYAIVAKHDRAPYGGGVALFAIVILSAAGAVAVSTLCLAYLPTIMVGNSYGRMTTLGVGPVVLGCNLVALILVVTRLGVRSTLSLWVAVAMVAACLDVSLGLIGSGRFTFGWYLGRALSLLSNLTVFIALLFESMRLFGRVSRMNRHLEYLSLTDQLTQLPNRRAFEANFAVEWRRAEREMLPISLLMVDVDQFKGFNDSFGHPAGDRCLRLVAETLGGIVRRPLDLAARLGGEEFVLLLPNTEAAGAAWMGERVRAAIEALQIDNPGSSRGVVTASVGVATDYPRNLGGGPMDLLDRADTALYAAKRAGRNHVHSLGEGAVMACPPDGMAWCKSDLVAQA